MTDDEIKNAIRASLDNSLTIVKALFPSLIGYGLGDLSKDTDQATFDRAAQRIEQRLSQKDRNGEQLLDEEDRKIADHLLKYYRRLFTK